MTKREWMEKVSARYEGGIAGYYDLFGNLILPMPNTGDILAYYVASEASGAWDEARESILAYYEHAKTIPSHPPTGNPEDDEALEREAEDLFSGRMASAADTLKKL